jgi:hypothetical protein
MVVTRDASKNFTKFAFSSCVPLSLSIDIRDIFSDQHQHNIHAVYTITDYWRKRDERSLGNGHGPTCEFDSFSYSRQE